MLCTGATVPLDPLTAHNNTSARTRFFTHHSSGPASVRPDDGQRRRSPKEARRGIVAHQEVTSPTLRDELSTLLHDREQSVHQGKAERNEGGLRKKVPPGDFDAKGGSKGGKDSCGVTHGGQKG